MKKLIALIACIASATLYATDFPAASTDSLTRKKPAGATQYDLLNGTFNIASGDMVTFKSGSTLTLSGSFGGTPTGGTLNLSNLTLTLPAATIGLFQPLDDDLTAIAALSTTATGRALLTYSAASGDMVYYNGTAWTQIASTANGRSLLSITTLTAAGLGLTNGAALDALAAVSSTGLLARTGSNTYTARTLTGTPNEITVTNGDGVLASPTLSLPSALTFTGKTVTGGTFNSGAFNGTLGATSPSTIAATTISASGQITSTVTTGTAPFVVASTTAVSNLNASLLLGSTWASPAAIGTGIPAAGTFTTLGVTGVATFSNDVNVAYSSAAWVQLKLSNTNASGLDWRLMSNGAAPSYGSAGNFVVWNASANAVAEFGQALNSGFGLKVYSTVSGTSTSAAAILGKSLGLTENLYVGGAGNFAGNVTLGTTTGAPVMRATSFSEGGPTYAYVGDDDTGMWRSAPDTLQLVTGGSARLTVGSTGLITIANSLTMSGAITGANSVTAAAATDLTLTGGSSGNILTIGSSTNPTTLNMGASSQSRAFQITSTGINGAGIKISSTAGVTQAWALLLNNQAAIGELSLVDETASGAEIIRFTKTLSGAMKLNYTTSGTSTTAASFLAKSAGFTENVIVGGMLGVGSAASSSELHITNSVTFAGANIVGLRNSAFLRPSSASSAQGFQWDGTFDTNTGNLSSVTCVGLQLSLGSSNTVSLGYGIRILSPSVGTATLTTGYGLKIENQATAGTNYAIQTGTGLVSFGDALTVTTGGSSITGTTSTFTNSSAFTIAGAASGTATGTFRLFGSQSNSTGLVATADNSTDIATILQTASGGKIRLGGNNAYMLELASGGATFTSSITMSAGTLTLTGYGSGSGAVSVGAADSGGAGFKVLRVPN